MSGAFDIQEPTGAFAPQQPAQPAPPPAGDNEAKEREFVNTVRRLGRESGAGKEALPNLVVAVVDAIYSGALDPKKKFRLMDGTEGAAAAFILEQYAQEEGRKLAHERTELGKKTAASKINQIIRASSGKQADFNFRGAIDRAMEARAKIVKDNDKARVKPAFDTYVSMARKQLETKAALTDEQIVEAALRKAGYSNTFVKELKRMYTRLVKICGDGTKDGIRIGPDEPIYDSMREVALALEAAVKNYEPNFNEPEPAPAQTYSQQLGEQNRAVDEQMRQTVPA